MLLMAKYYWDLLELDDIDARLHQSGAGSWTSGSTSETQPSLTVVSSSAY